MKININDVQRFAGPVMALVTALLGIIAVVLGAGSHGGSSQDVIFGKVDGNVIFQVVDQHGNPRPGCAVALGGAPTLDIALWTDGLGRFGVQADPGAEVTRDFDCDPRSETDTKQTATATATAPKSGTATEKVIIANPETEGNSSF